MSSHLFGEKHSFKLFVLGALKAKKKTLGVAENFFRLSSTINSSHLFCSPLVSLRQTITLLARMDESNRFDKTVVT